MCKVVTETFKDGEFVGVLITCLVIFGGIAGVATLAGVI